MGALILPPSAIGAPRSVRDGEDVRRWDRSAARVRPAGACGSRTSMADALPEVQQVAARPCPTLVQYPLGGNQASRNAS